jgi:NAD+ kinase
MSGKRILLISKTPLVARLEGGVLGRLSHSGVIDLERLKAAASNHEQTILAVRRALAQHRINEWQVDRLQPRDAEGKDLVVTVGGDGTVLTANSLDSELPMITVNSDPGGSVGMYTRCDGSSFPALFDAWLAGRSQVECIPRLQMRIDGGQAWRILNECLFASANPAAMTRYLLEIPEAPGSSSWRREEQRSSGVWIATASGSTAAIHSAGMQTAEAHGPALLFLVREPFQGLRRMDLLQGRQLPPLGLRLTPAMPGVSIFIDGPHIHRSVPPGSLVEFSASPIPLRLLTLPPGPEGGQAGGQD